MGSEFRAAIHTVDDDLDTAASAAGRGRRPMELREFVAESLRQIIDGVTEAQTHAAGKGAFVNAEIDGRDAPPPEGYAAVLGAGGGSIPRRFLQMVEFDVAVSASADRQSKAGAGLLTVVSFGGGHERGAPQEKTSRLRFTVPVALPKQNTRVGGGFDGLSYPGRNNGDVSRS